MKEALVKLKNVSFSYFEKNKKKSNKKLFSKNYDLYEVDNSYDSILENITLSFPNTGLFFIMGKSGSGKSTLLNILSGFISISRGKIDIPFYEVSNFFQDYKLFDFLTNIENIMFPLILKGESRKDSYSKALDLLQKFNLLELKDKYPSQISGGEKSRISLLRLIVEDKKILLVDEATGELDSNNGVFLMETIKELSKTKLVIFVTHNKELAYRYADKIYLLENKKIKEVFSKDEKTSLINNFNLVNIDNYSNNAILIKNKKEKISIKESFLFNFKMVKNRIVRIIVSSFFCAFGFLILTFCLLFSFSSKAFSNNIINSFPSNFTSYLYTSTNLNTDTSNNINITKNEVLTDYEIEKLNECGHKVLPCLDYFLGTSVNVHSFDMDNNGNKKVENVDSVLFVPVFNLSSSFNNIDKYDKVVVNSLFYQKYKRDSSFYINLKRTISLTDVESNKYILNLDLILDDVAFSNDFKVLNVPTIYYDYQYFYNYLSNLDLKNENNLDMKLKSFLLGNDYKRSDYLSHKNIVYTTNIDKLKVDLKEILSKNKIDNIKIESNAISIAQSFSDLINSLTLVISMFTIILLITTFLLEYISLHTLYEENRKYYANVVSFKLSKVNFERIVNNVFLIFFFVTFLIYLFLVPITYLIINFLLNKLEISSIVFLSVNLLFATIILVCGCILLFSFVSSYLSFKKIKKHDLIETLREV